MQEEEKKRGRGGPHNPTGKGGLAGRPEDTKKGQQASAAKAEQVRVEKAVRLEQHYDAMAAKSLKLIDMIDYADFKGSDLIKVLLTTMDKVEKQRDASQISTQMAQDYDVMVNNFAPLMHELTQLRARVKELEGGAQNASTPA